MLRDEKNCGKDGVLYSVVCDFNGGVGLVRGRELEKVKKIGLS